ncbi:hypothetical protein [Streptomyces sp. NPDC056512]|uniref:hypothetical protein n=1 Tax=Streptomyces sp. NPDC056512 TaxID=3345846 RepID=UPI00369FBB7A
MLDDLGDGLGRADSSPDSPDASNGVATALASRLGHEGAHINGVVYFTGESGEADDAPAWMTRPTTATVFALRGCCLSVLDRQVFAGQA